MTQLIPLLVIILNYENLCSHKNLSANVYCSIIHRRTGNNLKCPSMGVWISKLQYIHIAEYDPAIEKEQTTDIRNNTNNS